MWFGVMRTVMSEAGPQRKQTDRILSNGAVRAITTMAGL